MEEEWTLGESTCNDGGHALHTNTHSTIYIGFGPCKHASFWF